MRLEPRTIGRMIPAVVGLYLGTFLDRFTLGSSSASWIRPACACFLPKISLLSQCLECLKPSSDRKTLENHGREQTHESLSKASHSQGALQAYLPYCRIRLLALKILKASRKAILLSRQTITGIPPCLRFPQLRSFSWPCLSACFASSAASCSSWGCCKASFKGAPGGNLQRSILMKVASRWQIWLQIHPVPSTQGTHVQSPKARLW